MIFKYLFLYDQSPTLSPLAFLYCMYSANNFFPLKSPISTSAMTYAEMLNFSFYGYKFASISLKIGLLFLTMAYFECLFSIGEGWAYFSEYPPIFIYDLALKAVNSNSMHMQHF